MKIYIWTFFDLAADNVFFSVTYRNILVSSDNHTMLMSLLWFFCCGIFIWFDVLPFYYPSEKNAAYQFHDNTFIVMSIITIITQWKYYLFKIKSHS